MFNKLQRYIFIVSVLCNSNVAVGYEVTNIPHMRAFLQNIDWYMHHVVQEVEIPNVPQCPASDQEFVAAGPITPYTAIGASDRYFSSITLKATTCNIEMTINSSITNIPVPGFVKSKKILLTPEIVTVDSIDYFYWECKTNIDSGVGFQGAATISANSPSIISYYPENLYIGNCIYVATPF